MRTEDEVLKRMRQGQYAADNGLVLRTINLLRHKYERLRDVQYALPALSERQLLDSVNYLTESGYIRLRHVSSHVETRLEDADDYAELEAKVTAVGIRLLDGAINDSLVDV